MECGCNGSFWKCFGAWSTILEKLPSKNITCAFFYHWRKFTNKELQILQGFLESDEENELHEEVKDMRNSSQFYTMISCPSLAEVIYFPRFCYWADKSTKFCLYFVENMSTKLGKGVTCEI